ncbi:hypothetical protein GCM10009122_10210 [Fulvivirga kasyanovii]|uniref:HAD family hydrolase n=1 Tax=Fulvivirga kasyanovii TaxID=396812 RepID=A0ABW9RWM8_9BACT|nr:MULTISPECIES: hypothetical protein [Fulvivirga]MTI28180.1 hypothetical protein [Fulvivirga kasyanovii]UII33279.1 hypothetical protein LVD17_05505 [Fulvivirga ulvae]
MITRAIKKAFAQAKEKNWDKTFWAFDIHETIIKPNWSEHKIPTEFYPLAKEALQLISKRKDVSRILFTCSHPNEIEKYLAFFREHDIHFDHVNGNPEIISKKYGYYEKKPYFNVLFEDKAGFDPYEDWEEVIKLVKE